MVSTPESTSSRDGRRLPGLFVRRSAPPILVGALVLAGCATAADDANPGPSPDTSAATAAANGATLFGVDQFATLLDAPNVTVINVHVPYEGELPDTDAFAAYDQIVGDPALPDDRDAPIAVYCRSGSMSAEASTALVEAGYTDVRDLEGGMIAWEDAGRDLVIANS